MMKGMMSLVSDSAVIVGITLLQIQHAFAFSWKKVVTNIVACELEDVQLLWEYEVIPGEYIKAKTWFTGENKVAKRIAYWKDTDGLIVESEYRDRVTIIGNDGLLLKRVITSDEGLYTLIANFPLSSEPDPRLSLNLTVYIPPLENCCKPTIHQLENGTGLRASLHLQACGTQPVQLKWKPAPGTVAIGDVLMFDTTVVTGTFTVCVTGIAVEKCFKGRKESLCHEQYIEETREFSQTTEKNVTFVAILSIGGMLIGLAVTVVIIIVINWRQIKKCRARNKNWKAVRETFNFKNDDTLLQSLISDEVKMNKATKEISNIMYIIFNHSREIALEKIKTTTIALENSEIIYVDNATDISTGGDLVENHQTNPSYAQCFYHKDKLLKLLVVQGELGIGKTTWCRKLISTWCEAHECQYYGIPIRTNAENIQTLKSFPLLFFVSLRNVGKGQTLTNIIKQQCLMGIDTQNGNFGVNLDLLMEKCPDKVIFIIHGVDEAESDIDILNEIVSQTKNSLTILTCRDWESLRSKCRIQEVDYRPMAYITLKQVDKSNVTLYAKSIFDGYGYPKDAVSEFMELVRRNKLETFMETTYFVQPLIQIWHKSGMLPSDATDVCLCLIEDSLKEKRKQLIKYASLNLDSDVERFVRKARGKIFVIRYGKVLCGLGKVALLCLQNIQSKDIFHEDDLVKFTDTPGIQLTEICIAAKLVSTAPVSDSGKGNKRLCFQHNIIKLFLIAFHLACEGESQVKDIQSEERKMIQTFLTSLTSVSETAPHMTSISMCKDI